MFKRPSIPQINVNALKEKMHNQEKITLLDVRKPKEWAKTGIIPGSVMLEMRTIPREIQNGLNLKSKEPIIVYCRTGVRSRNVTNYLINELGINAINLEGGIVAWYAANGAVEQI